jgi:hypothetical protein
VSTTQIAQMQPAQGNVVGGEFWRADPNASRLFFAATGRSLEQGQAYFGTYLIVLPFVAVGVTDFLTIAACAPLFDDTDVGLAYTVGTFGSRDNALTLGLGWGYAGSDFASKPVAMVGGELRTSRRAKLITENYFLPPETGVVLSGGFRFIGERFSADVGIGAATGDSDSFCCVPLVNVSYLFGN